MRTIEMRTYYDIPLHCPFCGGATSQVQDDEWRVSGCKHLQLMTNGEITPFMSERAEKVIVDAGYEVDRDEFDIEVSNAADDDDWPDLIQLMSIFPDVVIFEQVVGPPSLEVSYTVFAFNDGDYAEFGNSL